MPLYLHNNFTKPQIRQIISLTTQLQFLMLNIAQHLLKQKRVRKMAGQGWRCLAEVQPCSWKFHFPQFAFLRYLSPAS